MPPSKEKSTAVILEPSSLVGQLSTDDNAIQFQQDYNIERTKNKKHKSVKLPDDDEVDKNPFTTDYLTSHEQDGNELEDNWNFWKFLQETFLGNTPLISQALSVSTSSTITSTSNRTSHFTRWIFLAPLLFIDCTLRAVGSVTFASNPFSGFIILIAMFISSPTFIILSLASLFAGLATAFCISRIPIDIVRGGSITFNCFLLGTVIASLADSNLVLSERPDIILLAFGGGSLSIFVWGGFHGLLSYLSLPPLNSPTNLIALLYITSGLSSRYQNQNFEVVSSLTPISLMTTQQLINITNNSNGLMTRSENLSPDNPYFYHFENNVMNVSTGNIKTRELNENPNGNSNKEILLEKDNVIQWSKVLQGAIYAPRCFFGTNTFITCAMVYSALFLYSPIATFHAFLGSVIGNFIGAALIEPPYTSLYDGTFAYNGYLTCAALSGLFLVLNLQSFLLGLVGAILSTILQVAMVKCQFPVLGIPFMLITWLLMSTVFKKEETSKILKGKHSPSSWLKVIKVEQFSTPELHMELQKERSKSAYKSVVPV